MEVDTQERVAISHIAIVEERFEIHPDFSGWMGAVTTFAPCFPELDLFSH